MCVCVCVCVRARVCVCVEGSVSRLARETGEWAQAPVTWTPPVLSPRRHGTARPAAPPAARAAGAAGAARPAAGKEAARRPRPAPGLPARPPPRGRGLRDPHGAWGLRIWGESHGGCGRTVGGGNREPQGCWGAAGPRHPKADQGPPHDRCRGDSGVDTAPSPADGLERKLQNRRQRPS